MQTAIKSFLESGDAIVKLGEKVRGAQIENAVHGIKPQAVEVEIAEPIERIFEEVFANGGTIGPVEIDSGAPRRAIAIGEVRSELAENISLGAEVVVDDVKNDGEAFRVCGVNECLQGGGTAVGILNGVREDAVVAPVARAGKL